ncbi:MAG: hypothetical protein NTU88_00015, partial [Armatimonadetes bacterium]|nr:hypothetical protein [Armatimonadota bacterium]
AEGEMVKEHLAGCESCARELAMLRSTAGMLASVGEVEPPASLLERIEAVTVNRPTLRARLRAALAPLFRLPAYARWTAAAAVALLIALASQPGLHQATQVKPGAPSSGITAKQPSRPAETQPKVASITVTEQGIEGVRPVVRAHRRHRAVASNPALSGKATARPASSAKPAKVEPNETTEPSTIGETAPASESPAETNVASATTSEQPKAEIKLARTSSVQADWQKKEADALADLRAKLAARNKQRKYQVREEPIQDTKYSVALGSVRF